MDNLAQELNLERIGATICLKYIDPANQKRGGKADITIANLKKLIPRAKSEKVSSHNCCCHIAEISAKCFLVHKMCLIQNVICNNYERSE